MVSVDTSYAATAAKFNTRDIDKLIAITRKRIASGIQLSGSRDNPQAWATVQLLQSALASAKASQVAIAKNKAIIDVAAGGVIAIGKLLADMASKVTAAINGGEANKAVVDVQTLQVALKSIINSTVQSRVNMLNGTSGNLVLSLGAGSSGTENLYYLRPQDVYKVASSGNSGYLGGANSVIDSQIPYQMMANKSQAQDFLKIINTGILNNNIHLARLQGFSGLLDNQSNLLSSLADVRSKTIGGLVNIDLDEEKARLVALQARQDLVQQTLSIANGSISSRGQYLVSLFQPRAADTGA